jgi:hypothetical protein
MATNVVRVNGDYKIQTGQGGSITLDTASSDGSIVGNVNLIGNLTVTGSTTTGTSTVINTVDLTIKDNTIILNNGETGNGVSQTTAGIIIRRGSASSGDASILWNETQSWDDPASGATKTGLFIFSTAIGGLNGIRTNSIDTNGSKLYITTGSNTISVHGASNYHLNVSDDNDIPNKKYVDKLVSDTVIAIGGAVQQFPPNPNTAGWLYNDGANLSWTTPTATNVGLGNVTNESKSTMFTSAALTGTPTAPTASGTTNTTQIATTEFVQNQIVSLLDSVDNAGNTLGKLYTLIGTANTNIALKAPINSPTFTGTVSGVTATMVGLGNVTNESKSTMFASPIFTGTVSGVTAAMVGLGNVTNESKSTMFTSPTFTGHPTIEGVTATGATGTGKLVFDTSPTFTTPTLGAATATTINKVSITAPATSATLNIGDGKTLNVLNAVTLSGTDNSTITFGVGGTVAYTRNNLSVFAATTSAQLAGVISDETGSGSLVFATNPTFTTSIDSGATFGAFASATTLTIGNTTAASTTNISTAALTTGTKTINIGTGGTSTAVTNINIGSSTGTTTTIYGFASTSPSFTTSVVTGNSSFDVFNTTATTVNAFGAATTATIGYTGTGATSTTNINTGALTGAFTKTINIGTGGTTGSTTNINIGSSTSGTTTINGNVGIGTSSPGAKLDIQSSSAGTATGLVKLYATNSSDRYSGIDFHGVTSESYNKIAQITAQVTNGGNGTGVAISGDLIFRTNGSATNVPTERMRIDSSGNVGIGTVPSYKLHVSSAVAAGAIWTASVNTDPTAGSTGGFIASASGTNNFTTYYQTVGGTSTITNAGAGYLYLGTVQAQPILFATTNAERMRIDSSGNVGIGTTSTGGFRVAIVGSTSSSVPLYLNTDATNSYVYSPNPIYVGSTGAYALNFVTNNATRATIDSSGNLLVGATSSVNGGSVISVAAGTVSSIITAATTSTNMIVFRNGNGNVGSVTTNGTSTSYNTGSDYRLKENVTPMTIGLATISALKPVNYDWISDKSQGEGFIAHELQAIIPHAVTGEKDAVDADGKPQYQGVDYSKIVVHLVAAIQELSAEVEALKAKVGK